VDAAEAALLQEQGRVAAQVEAAGPTEEARDHNAALRARLAAREDTGRHLRIDRAAGTAELRQGAWVLRTFPVALGDGYGDVPVAGLLAPRPTIPAGVHPVVAAYGYYVGRVGVILPPPVEEAPWPVGESAPEAVVDVVALQGHLLLYSAVPPVPARSGPALGGTVRATVQDLRAVADELLPGANVYVW